MVLAPSDQQFEIVSGAHRATLVEVGGGIRESTTPSPICVAPRTDRPGCGSPRPTADPTGSGSMRTIRSSSSTAATPNAPTSEGAAPMTCPANSFRSGEGLLRIEPGASFTARWGIQPD
jgi:hypothetical protein